MVIEIIGSTALRFFWAGFYLAKLFLESLAAGSRQLLSLRLRYNEIVDQTYSIAVQSVPVVVFSLCFVSIMLLIEFSYHVKLILHQDSLVPGFSTVLMVRELGPVITCLLLTSRVGAGIAAELGTMKVTDQIDALRLLSIDPVEYLVIPRWVACVVACTCLSIFSLAIGILGGAAASSLSLGRTVGEYFNSMFVFTHSHDFTSCLIKATVFGTIIPIVASHHGLRCRLGSEGVGNAATAAVVQGSMLIIIADFVLTYLLYAV